MGKNAKLRKRKGVYLQQMTVYVEPMTIMALEEYQLRYRQRTGDKIELSEVVRQAIRKFLDEQA